MLGSVPLRVRVLPPSTEGRRPRPRVELQGVDVVAVVMAGARRTVPAEVELLHAPDRRDRGSSTHPVASGAPVVVAAPAVPSEETVVRRQNVGVPLAVARVRQGAGLESARAASGEIDLAQEPRGDARGGGPPGSSSRWSSR